MTTLSRRLIQLLIVLAVVLACGLGASALLGWTPGSTGLPADIAAIDQPGVGN